MQCDICYRTSSASLPFHCTTCARNSLYGPRIQHAQVLLEAQNLAEEVEKNASSFLVAENRSGKSAATQDAHPTSAIERLTAEREGLEERTEIILAHVDQLQNQTKEMRDYIRKKKAELANRRSNLDAANKQQAERPKNELEPIEKGLQRTKYHWDALHSKTAEARSFLCTEAAELYDLQQRKRKKGSRGRDLYLVAGIPTCDLRDLNNASPSQLSISTTSLAHLTHLVSHYLGIRLPAEIIVPHRDYPLPTILSPGSSYGPREVPYPGFTPLHSLNSSPTASKTTDTGPLPRPRPLHLDKKLPILAKDDPLAYASFVEGMTLLAWDIAWICKTQGLEVGKGSWEEVCAMGKNLWQLLLGPNPAPKRQLSAGDAPVPNSARAEDNTPSPSQATLGHFSHNTTHSLLSASEGIDYMSGWRYQSPIRVIDKVKAMLLSERDGAEWQILEENEWEEEATVDGTGGDDPSKGMTGGETVLIEGVPKDVLGSETRNTAAEEDQDKIKGTSGWTKLKSRGAP